MTTTPTPTLEAIILCATIEMYIRNKQSGNGFISTKLDLFSFTDMEKEQLEIWLERLQEIKLTGDARKKLNVDLYIEKISLYLQV